MSDKRSDQRLYSGESSKNIQVARDYNSLLQVDQILIDNRRADDDARLEIKSFTESEEFEELQRGHGPEECKPFPMYKIIAGLVAYHAFWGVWFAIAGTAASVLLIHTTFFTLIPTFMIFFGAFGYVAGLAQLFGWYREWFMEYLLGMRIDANQSNSSELSLIHGMFRPIRVIYIHEDVIYARLIIEEYHKNRFSTYEVYWKKRYSYNSGTRRSFYPGALGAASLNQYGSRATMELVEFKLKTV